MPSVRPPFSFFVKDTVRFYGRAIRIREQRVSDPMFAGELGQHVNRVVANGNDLDACFLNLLEVGLQLN
jgi:hypothetical protein